jgi:hypothetical protein
MNLLLLPPELQERILLGHDAPSERELRELSASSLWHQA